MPATLISFMKLAGPLDLCPECRSGFSKRSFALLRGNDTDVLRRGPEVKLKYDQIPGRRRTSTPLDIWRNLDRSAHELNARINIEGAALLSTTAVGPKRMRANLTQN